MAAGLTAKRALVVEDEPAIGLACSKVLTSEGFEVDIAPNGLIALQMAKDNTYSLCLSDIRIPVMGGIEFYNHLTRERPELARRIIFMSGDILSGNISEFLKKSGRPFLPKPFDLGELKQAIRDLVGKR